MRIPNAAQVFERLPTALRRHKLMTLWMRLTGEDPIQLVRIRDDSFAYADMSDGFLRLIVIEGDYESDFFRIADALLRDGGDFLDIGANHGLFSFGLAGRWSNSVRFHMFEPNPRLQDAIRASAQSYPSMQYTLNGEALAEEDTFVQIKFEPDQTGISHIVKEAGTTVASRRIDTYLDMHRITNVAFAKMDIEGYELFALRGAESALKRHRIAAVYFEYSEKLLERYHQPSDLLQAFESVGYEVCFCREYDLERHRAGRVTIRTGLPGHGLPLVPIRGRAVPETTDLLAVPRENLID